MPKPRHVLAPLLLVAACAQAPDGAPGPVRGAAAPEARAVETTGRTGQRVLGLSLGHLGACSAIYDPPTLVSPVRTTDLACTGGVTGTVTVGPDLTGGRSVRWALETGESGRTPL